MRKCLGSTAFDGKTTARFPPRDDFPMIHVVNTADSGARSDRLRETLRDPVATININVFGRFRVIDALAAFLTEENMDLAVIRPAFEAIGRLCNVTVKMLHMHLLRPTAVRDDMRAIVIVDDQL